MDYKNIYENTFNKKMEEINSDVLSQVKTFKERKKNFTAVANLISKDLGEKENNIRTTVLDHFPDLYELYKNRFDEYESDHLTSFFKYDFTDFSKKYPETSLEDYAVKLGALESYSRAAVNFSNSDKFLEAIYVLDKNYEHYTLNFDSNLNPIDSDVFFAMQKERFPGYGQAPDWEGEALKNLMEEDLKKRRKPKKTEQVEQRVIKPGGPLDKSEKRYILHLLYELLSQGSEMKAPEFMRILHLTTDIIDHSAEITGNPPHYRQVHEGFSKNYPKNDKIVLIKRVMSQIHGYQLPKLKQILSDKLIALTKIK